MKIKEVENQTGITSHNIRFYEKENLIVPKRNSDNGYREYTEQDVEVLKRIRLMRMLDIPVSDIRDCLDGTTDLSTLLSHHRIILEAEEKRIRQNQILCRQLSDLGMQVHDLPVELIEQVFTDKDTYVYQIEKIRKYDRIQNVFFTVNQLLSIAGGVMLMVLGLIFFYDLAVTYMSKPAQILAFLMITFLFGCIGKIIIQNEKQK